MRFTWKGGLSKLIQFKNSRHDRASNELISNPSNFAQLRSFRFAFAPRILPRRKREKGIDLIFSIGKLRYKFEKSPLPASLPPGI